MKRETLNGLRHIAKKERWSGWMPVEMAEDILAELKRLRRIERAMKRIRDEKLEGATDDAGFLQFLAAEALKKGGRK